MESERGRKKTEIKKERGGGVRIGWIKLKL